MKKRIIIIIIYSFFIILFFIFLYKIILNASLIRRYNNGEYDEASGRKLLNNNFYQSYVAHYNYGNILYQNGKYQEAIEEYKKSLDCHIPEQRDCVVRINYALALCNTVGEVDMKDKESVLNAINIYMDALNVLTENDCAHMYDNLGHNEDAIQLKKDILSRIEQLMLSSNAEPENKDDEENKDENKGDDENKKEDNKNGNDSNDMDKKLKEVEQKINDIKQEAMQEQIEKDKYYKDLYEGLSGLRKFSKVEKNW